MAQGEAMVSHNTLDLVELSQVSGIQRFIPEHTVDGEVLGWCEGFLETTGRPSHVSEGQMTVPSLSPRCPGPAAPSGPGGRGHEHWLLWCVYAADFSGPPPASNCTCTFRRKSEVHTDALGLPTSFPQHPKVLVLPHPCEP